MSIDNGESALSRWSRRKIEARRQTTMPEAAPVESPAMPAEAIEQPPAPAEEKPLTDADMPDIESLDEASDFSPFMSSGVSEALRNRALRKLFAAAAFNLRDGLDDYDDVYTDFEKLGDIVTCDMKHRIEMEEQKRREQLAEEAADENQPDALPTETEPTPADPQQSRDTQAEQDPDADDEETDVPAKLAQAEPSRQAVHDD